MKPTIKLITMLAAAASVSFAQGAVPGYEQTVTMTMAVYSTAPGTYDKDGEGQTITPKEPDYENDWTKENSAGDTIQENYEWVSKIETWKVGNKQILEELVDEDVIDAIAGWSIKIISEGADAEPFFFLVKDGAPPIYIGDYLHAWTQANAESEKYTEVTKYNAAGDETSYKETGSGNGIRLLKAILDTDGDSFEFNLHGMLTDSWKWDQDAEQHVSNGGTYKLVGSLDFPGDGDMEVMGDGYDSSVVEGTWKISKAKAIDISDYEYVSPS